MVGFPHSEILGSKLIRSSPRLIAAYYVLHRLHAPRHPLDALMALDRSHYLCPQRVLASLLKKLAVIGQERISPRLAAWCFDRSDQINQNSRSVAVSPRGTGQTSSKLSLYDVERSGQGAFAGTTHPNFALCTATYGVCVQFNQTRMVEPDGIEPTTSCLQSRRSPS